MKFKLSLLFLALLAATANSYKILCLFSHSSKSHVSGFLPLAYELASRKHDVTIVHPFSKMDISEPVKSLAMTEMEEYQNANLGKISAKSTCPLYTLFSNAKTMMADTCEITLKSKLIKTLLKEGKQYDIVIISPIMNECSLAIAPLLGKYLILFSAGPLPMFLPNPAPHPPSTVPNHVFPLTSRMNFRERFQNFVGTVLMENIYLYYLRPVTTPYLAEHVPEAPTAAEAWKKLSLIMVNTDVITASPRPSVPNMINVPGLGCRPATPLAKNFEDLMQSSGDDGVIVFSLGSVAESRNLPKETVKAFVDAFSRLKQKIVWKYEDNTLKAPSNVRLVNWMPQQDVLGHPKTRLLITHGGAQSLQEAVYHGVPVISIPQYGDQPGNAARMKELEIGEVFDLDTITADAVYETVTKMLNDKGYKERMKKYSAIFKDVLQPSVKKGAFWVEYVARHNGARHLRTLGEDMCLIKYFLLDVIAFLTLVPTVSLYAFYRLVKFGCRKYRARKQKKADKKKTQ